MRIAITGHTSGIGRALAGVLKSRGHEILGLSRREGYNIGSFVKIANLIEPCDVFINNAQASYAQTELLYEVWNKWRAKNNKHIWCISTIMTQHPVDPPIQGQDEIAINHYRTQKIAMEEAVNQLRAKKGSPRITIIRPGGVATLPGQTPGDFLCDPDEWAQLIVDTMALADTRGMKFSDLSLGKSKVQVGI